MSEHPSEPAPKPADDHAPKPADDHAPGFFDRPKTRKALWIILIALCVIFALAGFFVEMHGYFPIESFGAFYAVFGFAVFSFIVLVGQHLRKIIMRSEDYYDR